VIPDHASIGHEPIPIVGEASFNGINFWARAVDHQKEQSFPLPSNSISVLTISQR
jgi:hypothetical protein